MTFSFKRRREDSPRRSLLEIFRSVWTPRSRKNKTKSQATPGAAQLPPPSTEPPSSRPRARTLSTVRSRPRTDYMKRLPNEILVLIFNAGAHEDSMLPVRLCHVCHAWRTLVLHTPPLWRRISLDSRFSLWSRRIALSRACTLDIELIPSTSRHHPPQGINIRSVMKYMHLVHPHIHRWRSLTVKFDGYAPYLWNGALSACCARDSSVHATTLEALDLIHPANDDTKEYLLFDGVAPRLRRVTLHGVRLVWLPSLFQSLTFLDYTHHGFTHGYQAAAEVLSMFHVSRALRELRLSFPSDGDRAPGRSVLFSRPVNLSCLLALELRVDGHAFPSALVHLLPHLRLPALHTLRLSSRSPSRGAPSIYPRLRHVLRVLQPMPALDTLCVAHGWLDARFVYPLLHDVPRLRRVVLSGPQVTNTFLVGLGHVLRARLRSTGWQLGCLELHRCPTVTAEGVVGATTRGAHGVASSAAGLYLRDCDAVDPAALVCLASEGVWVSLSRRSAEVSAKAARMASRRSLHKV